MLESDQNNNKRRASDFTDEGKNPTVLDVWHSAGLAHRRIDDIKVDQDLFKRAFLKDDLGTPDLDGHRKSHKQIEENEKIVQDYKLTLTKEVMKYIVAFVAGIITFAVTAYLKR